MDHLPPSTKSGYTDNSNFDTRTTGLEHHNLHVLEND